MELLVPDANNVSFIRSLIPDSEPVYDGTTLFTDAEIGHYYSIGRGNVLRAAGYAVLAIASSEAIISKVIKTQDLQTDGAKLAEALRKNADTLFARANAEDTLNFGFYSEIVDFHQGWGSERPELTEVNWSYLG